MTDTHSSRSTISISPSITKIGEIPAVMDFSMKVMPGECMGLVGESGCGKSTVALAIMRDLPGIGRITKRHHQVPWQATWAK
jgi:peptide/nickel transport system ATP-binding protein